MQDLGDLPGKDDSFAHAINNAGQVVGRVVLFTGISREAERAFLWTAGSGMQNLGTLPGQNSSVAFGINNAGQVVGADPIPPPRPALSCGQSAPACRTSVLAEPATSTARAKWWAESVRGAFLWSAGRGMQDLGTLPGEDFSVASGINNAGQVVGSSEPFDITGGRPFLWTAADGMQDPNALIDPLDPLRAVTMLVSANDINNRGQIVGTGFINGKEHGYPLTPVPEPETYAIMVAGLGLLGFMLRRRGRACATPDAAYAAVGGRVRGVAPNLEEA